MGRFLLADTAESLPEIVLTAHHIISVHSGGAVCPAVR
jgi:hypothetical protein